MKRFFLFCSGANTEVLKCCPTDEGKYVGIGATILLTAVLASLSGGYALFTVFQSVPAAVAFGALWGLVIFNLDRVIVSGMRKQRYFALDLLYAMPRLGVAFLLAVVISRPVELKLFDKELRNQWVRMQIDTRREDNDRIRGGDSIRLAKLNAENARLEAEVAAKRQALNEVNNAWILEKAGKGVTGIAGAGPVFREYEEARKEIARQMQEVEKRNDPLIRSNKAEIRSIEQKHARLIERTDDVRDESLGFLARLEAFGALKESNDIFLASLFITLLFISLETAPVVVKLLSTLSPYRPYDELLEQREFEIVEAARQEVRFKRHKLKADADQRISDYAGILDTELHLNTEKNQLRLDAELRANETLMQQIADAQTEIAERLVEKWKIAELEKIEDDLGSYTQKFP